MGHGAAYILVRKRGCDLFYRFPAHLQDEMPKGYVKKYDYQEPPCRGRFSCYDERGELLPKFWGIERLCTNNGVMLKPPPNPNPPSDLPPPKPPPKPPRRVYR